MHQAGQFTDSFDKKRPNILHPILKEELKKLINEYLEEEGAVVLIQYVESLETLATFLGRQFNKKDQ